MRTVSARLASAAFLLGVLFACVAPEPARADDWLIYLSGGLEAIEGGWEQRRGQVVFRRASGTLTSIPYSEVDLATSAFITFQLNGRTEVPPRSPLPERDEGSVSDAAIPCLQAVVTSLLGSETLEVSTEGKREVVHVACLDAPEADYALAPLGFFGRTTLSAIGNRIKKGTRVCLSEHSPPMRDGEGHRVVFITMDRGDDYTAGVIAAGLGLLRIGDCSRAADYRRIEDRAIAEGRGLWGRSAERAAFSVAQSMMAFTPGGTGAAGSSGRRSGGSALPPPRSGGG